LDAFLGGYSVFVLVRLLFLPIWLPLKLIRELIERSGRGRRRHTWSPRGHGGGWLTALLIVVVLAAIGGSAAAFSGENNGGGGLPTASSSAAANSTATPQPGISPSAAPSTPPPAAISPAPAGDAAAGQALAATTGCHPLTDEGTCYEPGDYCRTSDHDATGVAGDGEAITCEYRNGWRWEPTSAPAAPNPASQPTVAPSPTAQPSPEPSPTATASPTADA
jgi:hypothetical protein